jgi:hypothetical protein
MSGSNAELRLLVFQNGAGQAVPAIPLDGQSSVTLANNATTDLSIAYQLNNIAAYFVDFIMYRRVDGGTYRAMSGRLAMVGIADAPSNDQTWKLQQWPDVQSFNDMGVTFSLIELDVEKLGIQATLDNMAGTGHDCKFYYKITLFQP